MRTFDRKPSADRPSHGLGLGLSSKVREDRWRCVCVGHDARWLPHDTTDLSLSLSALSVEMVHSYETPSWHAAGKHVEHSNSWPQAAFVPFSPPRSVAPINTSFFAIIRLKKQQRPARGNKPTNDRSERVCVFSCVLAAGSLLCVCALRGVTCRKKDHMQRKR